LTEANYANGDYYHYTYDAVGNRLAQTSSVLVLPSTVNYVCDNANRIQTVNGVTYNFDANGNLLNDGVNAYTYDSANRLKTFNGTSSYSYNGLGDRIRQTVNGQQTNYTLDLNTGLTQVLNDGTNAYVYALGRIAQVNSSTEYFLGDALGSVRQLANQTGAITYARVYDPYGAATQTSGAARTAYGSTGEFTSNNLVYLRSRIYSPSMGRFLSRDTWGGDYQIPLSLNKWIYAGGNPVNRVDPSGLSTTKWNVHKSPV
jgi:RHS repeat-associated protein